MGRSGSSVKTEPPVESAGANGKVRRPVAGMKPINGNKTGENLAAVVMEVVKDWEIQYNLGYFMMDIAADC